MEGELRRLRAGLLHAVPLIASDAEIILPSGGSLSDPSQRKTSRATLLGDAEAEHLLLAGRTLSHIRRINRIPLTSAIAEQAEQIVGNSGAKDLDGDVRLAGADEATSKARLTSKKTVAAKGVARTSSASPPKGKGVSGRSRTVSAPVHGGESGLLGDLLHAAQTVLDPTMGAPHHQGGLPAGRSGSPKRRRVSVTLDDGRKSLPGWTPSSGDALQRVQDDDDEDMDAQGEASTPATGFFSALDVLAQASASQQASTSHSPPALPLPLPIPPAIARFIAPPPSRAGAVGPSVFQPPRFEPEPAEATKRVRSPYIKVSAYLSSRSSEALISVSPA
jgi:hypothetical protein